MLKLKPLRILLALVGGVLFLSYSTHLWADPEITPAFRAATELIKAERWDEAVSALREIIQQEPENALAHANLGVALSRLGYHKDALLAYETALQLGYDNARFRYFRGLSFANLNLLEEAAKEIELALAKNPRMTFADYDLGLIYSRLGQVDKAHEQVKKLYGRNTKLARKLFGQIPPLYKIMSVNNGGSLTGRVTLSGKVPKARAFHLIHAPNIQYCSRISDGKGHRILYDFTVSETGGLKDTVIAILGVRKGKPFPQRLQTFHINRCQSDKYVIGVRNNEDILIENTDPINHEVATYEFYGSHREQTSNKPVLPNNTQVRPAFVRWDTQEFLIKCNLHPFLQTHGYIVDNPYYVVSDDEGRFKIDDIPPGTYEVEAWHPYIPVQRGTVTIEPGKVATINFDFKGEDERRKLYQNDTKGYRFNTWYDSNEDFYGGPRIDDPVEVLQKFDNTDRYINWRPWSQTP